MNQMYTCSKSQFFSIIFSIIALLFTSTELFAKDIKTNDIDEILSLISLENYSMTDSQEGLVTRLETTIDDSEKIELLIQLNVYSMFLDRYAEVKLHSSQLSALAKKSGNKSAMEIAKIYIIVGEVNMQDPANFAQQKLQKLLPTLNNHRAKIHYNIAFAMTAIREDFPILENQLLRNNLNKISGQSNYSFEEFSILWALTAISKDASEYVDLTLQLLRSSNKHKYPISAVTFLYNLQWHLTVINELYIANRVANKLLRLAKENKDETIKAQILLAFLDNKVRINESVAPDTLDYIKSVKADDEFWQAWLNTIISFYYASEKDEVNSRYYLGIAKAFFNSQENLEIPTEFIEIESLLAFNNKDYIAARQKLEKFWWKKFLTIKTNQQNNIISVRSTLKNVIDEEQDNRIIVEQLLLKSERASFALTAVLFVIFILVIFQFKMYIKLRKSRNKLKQLSIIDGLTCMNNRRHWSNCVRNEVDRFKRNPMQRSSLLMLDIDFFKKVNDSFGHIAGDAVIKRIANIILEEKRSIDIEGRYGGEEFVLLLLDCNIKNATNVAERIRTKVEQAAVKQGGDIIMVTVSIGVAELDEKIVTMDSWVNLADTALYESKEKGRNRTSLYQKK